MNSEELESSLRTEFENYLKNIFADMKQEVSDFQENFETELDEQKIQIQQKIEAELEEQKIHFTKVFKDFSEIVKDEKKLEDGFRESVIEHMKLARDEGARITATAIAEAEKLEEETTSVSANFSELLDAVKDISSRDSQLEILKSLVEHAAQYTPRGAFFIVKNEHLVGWRVFGGEEHPNPQAVREVFFPLASDTALSESIKTLKTVKSSYDSYADDSIYLNQLDFEQPEKMYAVPLAVRGHGVAVLYADAGTKGDNVNVEALENLVRVAGLSVEVLASSGEVKSQAKQQDSYETGETQESEEQKAVVAETEAKESYSFADAASAAEEVSEDYSTNYADQEESFSYEQEFRSEPVQEEAQQFEQTQQEEDSSAAYETPEEVRTVESSNEIETQSVEEFAEAVVETEETFVEVSGDEAQTAYENFSSNEFQSEISQAYEAETPVQFDDSSQSEESEQSESETPMSDEYDIRPHFGDRNVDLPIEVDLDERHLHNKARRFAKLLVSEIKLYNEQKVEEGREASDLYERLREAIDRSREMYDKRVQPPVAAKFDYFHYELINTLAEGEENKLGGSYPGAVV